MSWFLRARTRARVCVKFVFL